MLANPRDSTAVLERADVEDRTEIDERATPDASTTEHELALQQDSTTVKERLTMPRAMLAHLRHLAAQQAPAEMVCLLGSDDARPGDLVSLAEVPNRAPNPRTHFFVHPHDQYRVEKLWEEEGRSLRAVAHSHPNGREDLSATDLKFAMPGIAMLLLANVDGEWEATAWSDTQQQLTMELVR